MTPLAQKNKGPLIDSAICRCCKTNKKCRLLTAEYEWSGKKEIYSEMFMDCFGLLLSHLDGENKDCGICATCVVRLRDAFAFRQQVLKCEEAFLKTQIQDNKEGELKLEIEVKTEPISNNDGDHVVDDLPDSEDRITENEAEINADPIASTTKFKPIKKPETSSLERVKKVKSKSIVKRDLVNKVNKLQTKLDGMLNSPAKSSKPESTTSVTKYRPIDYDTMVFRNAITIARYSYICPFLSRISLFYCFYCKLQFLNPNELREHTWTHSPACVKILMDKRRLPKIDITRIDCRLCPKPIDNLDTLKNHLEKAHEKVIYPVENEFLTFKLALRNLKCTECNKTFEYYNILHKHMAVHFGKFTCDQCGSCFLQERTFMQHVSTQHNVTYYTCEFCGKKMKSKFRRDMHVACIHEKRPSLNCHKCDEKFLTTTLHSRHLIEVHGETSTFPCKLCDKVYDTKRSLYDHNRKIHLKLLRHQCDQCSLRFYWPSHLKKHMLTHFNEGNNFLCEICSKSYPRLSALRLHIKTHNIENRYICDLCKSSFTQKCSLRSHLKTKHGFNF